MNPMYLKVTNYTCQHCGVSKDETLFDGYPFKTGPRKPTCKMCRNKRQNAKKWAKNWDTKRPKSFRLRKKSGPELDKSSGGKPISTTGDRVYRTDTYLADGRFGARIFQK